MKFYSLLLLLFIVLICCESKSEKDMKDLISQANKINDLSNQLSSMNLYLGEQAYETNMYVLCNFNQPENCYVNSYKEAIKKLQLEDIYKVRKDSVTLLLNEFNHDFKDLKKTVSVKDNQNFNNLDSIHNKINQYSYEINFPRDTFFYDYKKRLIKLKSEINSLQCTFNIQ